MNAQEALLLTGRGFDPPLRDARVRQLVDKGELRALRTVGEWRLIPAADGPAQSPSSQSTLSQNPGKERAVFKG